MQHQVSFPKFRTVCLNNQWRAFCQTNVSSSGRGREVFTTVSAAVHQQQLTRNEEADAPLNHPPCQGEILALLLRPILSDSLCSFMPKSHSVLHQYAGPLDPPPAPVRADACHGSSDVSCLLSRKPQLAVVQQHIQQGLCNPDAWQHDGPLFTAEVKGVGMVCVLGGGLMWRPVWHHQNPA